MNITQMRYVYEVAKTKSMNKAAENLKVAQPNISRQIKVLEEELGITIFERSTHGIRLTVQGEEFVGYAKGVVAKLDEIHYSDLSPFVELAHADPYVPTLPYGEIRRDVFHDIATRIIYVFERGSQFDLLARNNETFMWVSPIPDNTLTRFDLVQRPCADNNDFMRDILIYRKSYGFTDYDKLFINEINKYRETYVDPFYM